MSAEQLITLLLAVFAGAGASLVTGILGRPKVRAEAHAATTGGEVAISGDAREWARTFAERATSAEARADRAEVKAAHAEERADQAEARANLLDTRCDELEVRLIRLAAYTRTLQGEMIRMGGHPPEPPADLSPPL